jgi:hypothetical protein
MRPDGGQTITELGLDADLRAEPWRYPGPFLPFSCLQDGDCLIPLQFGMPAEFADHHWVVAIGSNASADVMRRKFERQGVSARMLHLVARLDGLALGHSAHVGVSGYLAAAVSPDPAATLDVVVSALTTEQLQCLDNTERNYDRGTVHTGRLHLDIPVQLPERAHIYLTKWGVIADEDNEPLPFGPQRSAFQRLTGWGILPAPVSGDIQHITRTLAAHEEYRTEITTALTGFSRKYPELFLQG